MFTLLSFLVLLFAGRKLAWDPLIAGLDSREMRINQAYQSAKDARSRVEHLIREYDALLDGFALDQAGYWHDVGHAEVLHRLGFIDRRAWLDALSSRCIGAHLHDVIGLGDHRAPGDGDVEWGYVVTGVQHLPGYTLEINQHQPDELVSAAPAFLESVGLR